MLTFSAYAVCAVRLESSGPAAPGGQASPATQAASCTRRNPRDHGAQCLVLDRWIAENTNRDGYAGDLAGALRGADVFIGLSAPRILSSKDVATMADSSIVFALANPEPEVDPDAAGEYAAVVATGRSDYPNQINNVLDFPGVFRGLLDAQSRHISETMLIAAAQALADVVSPDEIGPHYIIPSVFYPDVTSSVAAAVRDAATAEVDR